MTYLQPLLTAGLVAAALAFWAHARKPSPARRWMFLAVVAYLFLVAWPPFSMIASWTLEQPYPAKPVLARDVDAIVVLSGGAYPPEPATPYATAEESSYLRTRHAGWIYRQGVDRPIIVSGGQMPGEDVVVAEAMKQILLGMGVPNDRVLVEPRATSTYENAVFSTQMLHSHGWRRILLVTQAFHMPRSERCFRKLGVDVVPAPCDFRSREKLAKWENLLPNAKGLEQSENAIREWIAMAWYKVRGRI